MLNWMFAYKLASEKSNKIKDQFYLPGQPENPLVCLSDEQGWSGEGSL